MEDSKKEAIGTGVGGVTGTTVGVGGGIATIAAVGGGGLSGPGIMAGLATIGGSAVWGIAFIAGGTAALAGLGAFGGYKFFKKLKF